MQGHAKHPFILLLHAPPLANIPSSWNHLTFSTHACVSLFILFHPYFLCMLSSYSSSEPQPKSHLLLEIFPEWVAPCSVLWRLCLILACSFLILSFLFYSSLYTFYHQWAACSLRAQVFVWYFQVLCSCGGAMLSLLNKQTGDMAFDAPYLATDVEAGQLIRWQDWNGQGWLPASNREWWQCSMAPGMQKWGHPDHALMLVFSYYEDSAQVLCSVSQTHAWVARLSITLWLKFFHLESFAFTSKMDVERFSETSEFEVWLWLNSLGK